MRKKHLFLLTTACNVCASDLNNTTIDDIDITDFNFDVLKKQYVFILMMICYLAI